MTKRRWLLQAESIRCPSVSRAHQPPGRSGCCDETSSTRVKRSQRRIHGRIERRGGLAWGAVFRHDMKWYSLTDPVPLAIRRRREMFSW